MINYTLQKIIIFFSLFIIPLNLVCQQRYWIYFTDKNNVRFNPYQYFDTKAIQRRILNNISLYDYTDLPVNQNYIDAVKNITNEVFTISRWFNCVSVNATPQQLSLIRSLPFVERTEIIEPTSIMLAEYNENENIDTTYLMQVRRMQGELFHNNGFTGKGIRIAIFDGGFPGVDTNPVFEHLHKNNQIIKTWDFIKNCSFVYDYVGHGTAVLSCITGITNNKIMGLATGAEFLLARTEIRREPFFEEENWLAAAEWADKNGAHIINSSLGYTFHRYFPKQMDGKTSLVARAANMAASKGILVINALGNEGDKKWKYLITPADADNVLSVGAIDPISDLHYYFSSFGPTADKRFKPNVCAYGQATVASKTGITTMQGTSFAAPLVAGFAACAWQTDTTLTNMQLFKKIEQSAHLYPYYDYAHGYGVPQAQFFVNGTVPLIAKSFNFIDKNDTIYINVPNQFLPDSSLSTNNKYYLYYHIRNAYGVIEKYGVIEVYSNNVLFFPKKNYTHYQILMVHYCGYTESYRFTN